MTPQHTSAVIFILRRIMNVTRTSTMNTAREPVHDCGHLSAAKGSPDSVRAIKVIQSANGVMNHPTNVPTLVLNGARIISNTPQPVITAMTGATRKFAAIEIKLSSPESKTMMGKQKSVADKGIASASANIS